MKSSETKSLIKFLKLSQEEKQNMGWSSGYIVSKKFYIGSLSIKFEMRDKNGIMGRFGGGWNWKLGIQASGSTAIFSLLVAELIISKKATK
jgi:hypothetical protein